MYEGNITKAVKDDLAGEFLFRWKLISTFHDIGYLFEVAPPEDDVPNEPARTKGELIQTSFNIIDGFRDNFLADYFFNTIPARRSGLDRKATEKAHRDEVTREAETFKKALQPYPGNIRSEADLLTLSTAGQFNTDAFKLISKYVKPPRISGDLIKNYFYLCAAKPVFENGNQIRTAFYDHGIMSALVLLKAADVQRHYLNELSKKEFHGDLFRNSKVRNVLLLKKSENHLDAEQFFIRFSHVAGAIALHNINPTLFSQEQCQDFDIESARQNRSAEKIESNFYPPQPDQPYGISLDENPLSYLTALADTLQDWDRHSFRRLWFTEDSDPLTASELTMGFKDNMMHVRPLTPTATNKYAKLTSAKSMGHLIDWQKYLQIL